MKHLFDFIGFLRYVAARADDDRIIQVAASLTYTTLLSLVPLITIAMAVVAGIPAFSGIATDFKIFLLTTMVPEVAGKLITVYMEQFTDAAAQLTAVGIVFLAVTAILLMLTIDRSFNAIWHVRRPRPLMQSLLVYWAVLTVAPMLIGASVSLTSWVVSASVGYTQDVPVVSELLFKLASVVLSATAFALLYIAVPNRHVPWRHAVVGGVAAAIVFEAMKRGFGFYVSYFPTHRLIYGAFASIPIFLLWIYLSWLVILLGALVTASIPGWRHSGSRQTAVPAERFEEALEVLKAFHDSLRTGEVLTIPLLGKRLRLGFDELEEIMETMESAQWVRKAVGEGWLLVRDLEQIRVADVYRCFVFRHGGRQGTPMDERVDALLGELETRVGAVLDLSLKQLFVAPRAIDIKRTG